MKKKYLIFGATGSIGSSLSNQLFEEKIVSFLHKFSRDKTQVDETFDLVDGYGFQMVTDWLIGDLSNQRWEVKNATDKDIELYWNWANDEQVRNNALNKVNYPRSNHLHHNNTSKYQA